MIEETPVGGDERRVLEVRARTVDEAIARGLVRLGGLSRSEVDIEVLGEGRPGLLGFGAEEAAVRLTVLLPGEKPKASDAAPAPAAPPAPAPAPQADPAPVQKQEAAVEAEPPAAPAPAPAPAPRERPPAEAGEAAAVASEVTLHMVRLMGFEDATVEVGEALLPSDMEDDEALVLSIRGRGTDRLLAYDAEALNALQFLVRLVVSRRLDGWMSVLLDVNGDRARRVKELLALATQSADLVQKEGRAVALPPMSAYERRVVHLVLRDHPTVATQSIGSGSHRKVTVRMKDQLLPEH
jgi:spoIIIJ-associated protein